MGWFNVTFITDEGQEQTTPLFIHAFNETGAEWAVDDGSRRNLNWQHIVAVRPVAKSLVSSDWGSATLLKVS